MVIGHASGHQAFHNGFYEHLTMPGTNIPCCNNQDCRAAEYRVSPDGVYFRINELWVMPPPDRLIEAVTPDGGGHWCGVAYGGARPHTYCAIIPPSAS